MTSVDVTPEFVDRLRPAKSSSVSLQMNRWLVLGVAGALVCQIVLLVIAGWQNRHMLNPDATAYIQIAKEYANGQFRVAVSGYWGPMPSWLLVPTLGVIHNPLDAGRIVMALSAVVFLVACVNLFRTLDIHPAGIVLGAWLVALASISWSVENITPDLFMSGLLFFAISQVLSPGWLESRRTQWAAGVLCGAAYLTKAVAFPVSLGIVIAIGALWMFSQRSSLPVVLKAVATTLLALVLVAAPWIGVLSFKYGGFVISTSAKINHALVGPPDVERRPPDVYGKPVPGRLTIGEDPTDLPWKYWSPFESLEYFKHQLKLIYSNASLEFDFLYNFDRFHIGLVAVILGLLIHRPWRKHMATEQWRWGAIPIACVCAIYLPVYAFDLRYYYPAYPFLIAAGIGLVVSLTRAIPGQVNVPQVLGMTLVTLSFAQPFVTNLPRALKGFPNIAAISSAKLVNGFRSAALSGPIAGAGDCRAYFAQYVGFFLQQPYYGCEESPTTDQIKASAAKWLVVVRKSALNEELRRDSSFVSLDNVLFESQDHAANSVLKAYQIEVP